MKTLHLKLALVVFAVLLTGAVGEIVVRVVGATDESGNFTFRNRIVRPHVVPVASVTRLAAELAGSSDSFVMADPHLGWVPRPHGRSADGLYAYNAQGIRSPREEFPPTPPPGVLRIALFGDSFTHGDDVVYAESWGAQLEAGLVAAGQPAEVLNFGVGGYGLDQALLRFSKTGKGFAPDVVVLGFQPENLKRDLNLLRPLYEPRTRLPFAKPRFVLADGGISLINVPVPGPDEVPGILADLENWPLLPYEGFYDPADYGRAWWQHSRLLATIAEFRRGYDDPWAIRRSVFRPTGEEPQLGWAIIQALAGEARQAGADFVIVHLPTVQDLYMGRQLGKLPYQRFLDALDRDYPVAHPEQALTAAIEAENTAAVYKGHFNARGNRIVAEALQAVLLARVRADTTGR
ncbi:SGNH/GDSL hydrolase family protein [bacterium]|nr:SGNH/GDSL hydrolase family protein [bacterium]